MKKWIRWKGLIAFVLIVIVLVLFFLLFIDSAIKHSIEYTGTRALGAKVELRSAEFSFSPLGIELNNLQLTNPDEPMFNIVDIEHIAFNLDGLNLLRRKLLIKEMQVDRIRLNTPRRYSGAIKQKPAPREQAATAEQEEVLDMPAFATPDMDQIFAREKLKTPELASEFKSDVQKTDQNWDTMSQQLPDKKRINAYKQRINNLKQVNTKDIRQLKNAIDELKSLDTEISADVSKINNTGKQIDQDFDRLNKELKALKHSPKQEYARLAEKYSFSGQGVGNISQLLFGEQAKKWTQMALQWYKKLEPYIGQFAPSSDTAPPPADRHKGVNVRFPEHHPQPEFLIQTIRASVDIPAGRFHGKIMNVTNEQHIIGKPTTLAFSGRNMKGLQSLQLSGDFNHINPAIPKDHLQFSMKGYALQDHSLINTDELSIRLTKAKSDLDITATREKDAIQAKLNSNIHSIQYDNVAGGNDMAKLLLAALNDTRNFKIFGSLHGSFDSYSTRIKSDLDERLNNSLKRHFKRQADQFKQDLKKRIEQEAKQPIAEAEGEYTKVRNKINQDIDRRKRELDQQRAEIKQKTNEYKAKINALKQQVKDKITDKLKGALDKFKR